MACSFIPFARAAAILVLILFYACFTADASQQSSSAYNYPPIAIISEGEDSDAFAKVVGALCEKKSIEEEGSTNEQGGSERNLCRHFVDANKVSSILTRDPQAFDAVVTEVRVVPES